MGPGLIGELEIHVLLFVMYVRQVGQSTNEKPWNILIFTVFISLNVEQVKWIKEIIYTK